jgi:hypothetical protein
MTSVRCTRCRRMVDPLTHGRRTRSRADRLWEKVDASGECWLFIGARDRNGYGKLSKGPHRAGHIRAHRAAWETMVGPIPDGWEIDHLCRNPPCVNPDHLEPVPPRINVMRGQSFAAKNARKTHCVHGHEFTESTTAWFGGRRQCKPCTYLRHKLARARIGHPAAEAQLEQLPLFEEEAA